MKLAIITIAIMLSSCSVTTKPVDGRAVEAICGLFVNITYDGKNDTAITKEQVRSFNAKRDALCGK